MASNIPAEILQQQAQTTAPGVQTTQQAQPKNLANGRQQPGQKGKKTAAQAVYPKLASQSGE